MKHLIKSNFKFNNIIKGIYSDNELSKYCLNVEVKRSYPNEQLWIRGEYIESKQNGYRTLKKRIKHELKHYKVIYKQYFHDSKYSIKEDDNGVIE